MTTPPPGMDIVEEVAKAIFPEAWSPATERLVPGRAAEKFNSEYRERARQGARAAIATYDRLRRAAPEWQPISTAPKTSRAILVWCPERKNIYVVSWFNDPYLVSDWVHFGVGVRATLSERPTHWQPLPEEPK